jgi:hypothetical protein
MSQITSPGPQTVQYPAHLSHANGLAFSLSEQPSRGGHTVQYRLYRTVRTVAKEQYLLAGCSVTATVTTSQANLLPVSLSIDSFPALDSLAQYNPFCWYCTVLRTVSQTALAAPLSRPIRFQTRQMANAVQHPKFVLLPLFFLCLCLFL